MKVATVLIVLLIIPTLVFSQLKSSFLDTAFKIQYVSADIVNLVKKEFSPTITIEKELKQYNFTLNHSNTELFIKSFEKTYENARREILKYDYLANIPQEVEKYAVDQLSYQSYSVLPPNIAGYFPEVIKKNVQNFFGKYYDDFIENQPEINIDVRSMVEIKFAAYKFKFSGDDLGKITDLKRFEEKLTQLDRTIEKFKGNLTTEYIEFNNAVNRYAFKLKKIYTRIDAITSETALQIVVNNYQDKFKLKCALVKDKLANEVGEIKQSFERINASQAKIDSFLIKINKGAENYQNELKKIEAEIKRKLTLGITREVEQLRVQYVKYARKLEFIVNLSKDIINGKVDYDDVSSRIKDIALNQIFGDKADDVFGKGGTLEKEFSQLKAEDFENLISVTQNFAGTLQSLGVLKGKDAQRVNKFIAYASAAFQIGSGIGKLYAGDPSGIMNIMSGIGGLKGGEGSESQEVQMLKNVLIALEQISAQLIDIQKSIDTIDKKIDELYETMVKSFQIVFSKLDAIKFQLDNIQEISRLLLFSEYNSCDIIMQDIGFLDSLTSYNSFDQYYNNDLAICLKALHQFASSKDEGFFYLELNTPLLNQAQVTYQVENVYKPLLRASKYFYGPGSALNDFYNSLLLPVKYPFDLYKPLYFTNFTSKLTFDQSNSIEKLFNYEMINQYVKTYDKLSTFFDISWADQNFNPDPLNRYLTQGATRYRFKNNLQKARIEKLLNITNKAIIQQTMLSGGTLINNFISSYSSKIPVEELKNIDTLLDKNRLIANNVALAILADNLKINPISRDTSIVFASNGKIQYTTDALYYNKGYNYKTTDSTSINIFAYADSLCNALITDNSVNNFQNQSQRLFLLNEALTDFTNRQYAFNRNRSIDTIFSFWPVVVKSVSDSARIWVSDISFDFKAKIHNKYDRDLMAIYDSCFIMVDSAANQISNGQNLFSSLSLQSKLELDLEISRLVRDFNTLSKKRNLSGIPFRLVYDGNTLQIEIVSYQHSLATKIDAPYPFELRDCKLNYTQGLFKLLEARKILTNKLMAIVFNNYLPNNCNGLIDETIYKIVYMPR